MTELSLQDVVNAGELVDVRILSFSGGLADRRDDLEEDDVEQDLQAMVGQRPGIIEVRVHATIRVRNAEYTVQAATQLHHDSGLEISEDLARDFAERVGVMAIYPYVREAVQSACTRLRQRVVVLPLLRAGELSLASKEADPEAGSTDA